MTAFVFVTAKRPVRLSLAFLCGVTVAVTPGVTLTRAPAGLLADNVSLGNSCDKSSTGTIVQLAFVGLLAALAVNTHSWLVDIIVCAIFAVLILGG